MLMDLCAECINESVSEFELESETESWARTQCRLSKSNKVQYKHIFALAKHSTQRQTQMEREIERVTKRRRVWRNEHECISQIHLRAQSYLSLHARFAVRCVLTQQHSICFGLIKGQRDVTWTNLQHFASLAACQRHLEGVNEVLSRV